MFDELIPPQNDIVKWNPNEKVVGIVGVAPYATVDFYRKLLEFCPAQKDWEFLRVIVDFNTKIPSRGRCLDLNETNPSPYIRQNLIKLYNYGARVLAVPCNTAHYFYEEYTKDLGFPVVNMIEATSKKILSAEDSIRKVGILASAITTKNKLYEKYLNPYHVEVLSLPEEQEIINRIIGNVKRGTQTTQDSKSLADLLNSLQQKGAEGIIIGCTELSAVLPGVTNSFRIFDSNEILARTCYELAK